MVVVNLHNDERVHQKAGNPDLGLIKAVHVDHASLLTSSNWSAKQRRRKNSKCKGLLTFSLKSKSRH